MHMVSAVDFIGIGSRWAGSSWLHANLLKHPEIYLNGKEHHYWDRRLCSLEEYWAKFNDKGARKAGDITPAYEHLSSETIHELKEVSPNIKAIYIIRNPIEKAWSGCFRKIQRRHPVEPLVGSNEEWYHEFFQNQFERGGMGYKTQLQNWLPEFSWDQFLLLLHDFMVARPNHLLRRILRHLEVKDVDFFKGKDVSEYVPSYGASRTRRFWKTQSLPAFLLEHTDFSDPNRSPPMPEFARSILQELYRDTIEDLGEYLSLDLSHWLAK